MEPIQELEIKVPEELMGEVMTDLQSRRSMILGMEALGAYQRIKTRTSLAELHAYSTAGCFITKERTSFKSRFAEYSPVPHNVQEKLIKK